MRGGWRTVRIAWAARGRIGARRAQASAIVTRRAETACGLGSPQANRARPKVAPTWKAKNDLVDHKDAGSIPARAAEVGSAEDDWIGDATSAPAPVG